jgi:hypothetical protein
MYVKASNGTAIEYPYSLARMRADNPNISFPREIPSDLLAEYGVFRVERSARPSRTSTQDPVEQPPQLIEGVWTQMWGMVDVSPEEAARRQQAAADVAHAAAVKADAFVQNFIGMTPAQVTAYVEGNTNNITEVRALLNKMALMLLALARREYR